MQKKILYSAIILYIVVITAASFWKYEQMHYNAIDLAYYNQVFWKTIHGDLFGLTIHPHISLGDHVEPFILLLAPFYALFPDARTLLFLQTLFLALTALPIYSITLLFSRRGDGERGASSNASTRPLAGMPSDGAANRQDPEPRQKIKDMAECLKKTASLPLLLSLLWLTNPLVQNINLFELHILPFALLPLFYALLAYEEKRMSKFVLWSLLALTVREDVALVIGAFALLGLHDMTKKRSGRLPVGRQGPLNRIQWIIVPLLLSFTWFFAAQKIAAHFAVGGVYKFLSYYAWLGNSFPEILLNIVHHPLVVIMHIATANTGLFFLALGIPFLFLFLTRPRALLLTIPILLQNLLTSYGGTPLIAETHYVTLLLPALVLATMSALTHPPKLLATFPLRFLLVVATLYGAITLGPLPGIAIERALPQELQSRTFFIKQIPLDAKIATTESFLTQLSRRTALYLLRYATAGKTQFNKAPYTLPADVEYILIDANDLIAYPAEDAARLEGLLAPFGVIAAQEQFFLLQRGKSVSIFDEKKQNALEARITNESPCSMPPLTQCSRLTITTLNDGNVFLLNNNTTRIFPSLLPTYWLPTTTLITHIETGNVTSITALSRDRSTQYQREITDRRNLHISRQ